MNTIDALEQLKQLGEEDEDATEKLNEAAAKIALKIINACPAGVDLPRDYVVRLVRSNVGSEYFLVLNRRDELGDSSGRSYWIDGTGNYLHGDFHAEIPPQTRAGSLQFAKDITEGLLDEIAEFLKKRASAASEATDQLLAALPQAKEL